MYREMMKFKVKVPASLNLFFREMLAREIINTIIDRTSNGKDISGNAFKGYSKAYTQSEVFNDMQKTGRVNLRLYGEMLNAITYDIAQDAIEISFDDELEAAKAYNHNTGDTVPKREFFGLNNEE